MFGLTSLSLLVLLIVGIVAVFAGTLVLWDRWPRLARWPARAGGMVLLMVLAVALTGVQVNRGYGFYTSWGDLFNSEADVRMTAAASLRQQRLPTSDLQRGVAAASQGHGTVLNWRFPGLRSGLIRNGLIYLPAAYFDQSLAQARFPVVELLHGYSGSPANWTHALNISKVLDSEISAGRMPPVIAVMPREYMGHDSECVDAVGGEKDETYLAVDVPTDTARSFRTVTAPGSWATLGFSTGAFCAVNMALHHPSTYRAAASLSGYFTPIVDRSTGNLYRGKTAVKLANTPRWWVRHRPVRIGIYAFASAGDRDAWKELARFRRAVPASVDLTTVTAPAGGHNATVWQAALPPALDWLGQRLPGPTETALVEQHTTIEARGSEGTDPTPYTSGGPTTGTTSGTTSGTASGTASGGVTGSGTASGRGRTKLGR